MREIIKTIILLMGVTMMLFSIFTFGVVQLDVRQLYNRPDTPFIIFTKIIFYLSYIFIFFGIFLKGDKNA
jgi:hypothetical protein